MSKFHASTVTPPVTKDIQILQAISNSLVGVVDQIPEVIKAIDRNTAAIYDTAKLQPLTDQFLEQIKKTVDFLYFVAEAKSERQPSNPSITTALSLANKLATHLEEIRRAK